MLFVKPYKAAERLAKAFRESRKQQQKMEQSRRSESVHTARRYDFIITKNIIIN